MLELKKRKTERVREKGEKRPEQAYDLEEGATIDLTFRVSVDGNWRDMLNDFPQLINEGEKQYYTLRFPKFTDNIWYVSAGTYL